MRFPQFGTQGAIILLCTINLWSYIDRGIIPGAPENFNNFISKTLGVSVTRQSFYLGLLASSSITSYSIFCMYFGYLTLSMRPFRMVAYCMILWVIGAIVCGLAQTAESYYLLITGRIIAGIGEAAIQCNATPFIDTYAPKKNRALYLGVYLSSITAGTALGYIYGATFASSPLGWAGAYYTAAVIMSVLILCCLLCIPAELDSIPTEARDQVLMLTRKSLDSHLLTPSNQQQADHAVSANSSPSLQQLLEKQSFLVEWWGIFRNPVFTLVVLGHAGYTFSLAALSVFGPVMFIGMGYFETETQVSLVFGAVVVITGTVGTPLGGILVDRLTKRDRVSSSQRCYLAALSMFGLMAAAQVLALIMLFVTEKKVLFFILLVFFFFFLCASSPPETITVLELFPASRRSMAIAANKMVLHVLGDIPSPMILGWLKDQWAPLCGTVEIDGEAELNPECDKDREGLKNVFYFAVLWYLWAVFLWGAAVIVLKRRLRRVPQESSPL